jgi:3-methyladenine DNA glycosylase AlkD
MASKRELVRALQVRLEKVADKKTKNWWERYMRNVIEFRGVNLVRIREELHDWYKNNQIENTDLNSQLELALTFFKERYAEDKLAGVLFLQDYLYKGIDWKVLIPKYAKLFENGYIYDWNVCDWFSVRVLGQMIKKNGMPCARAIAKWNSSTNVWQARASLVAFVNLTKGAEFVPIILDSCNILIRREERFAKTAVGWILRELSKSNKDLVVSFVKKNKMHFSKEGLDNAIKYLN